MAPHGWPDELVEAYAGQRLGLVRLAYLITGDRSAAEEVVHDAFVATLRAWPAVREAGPYVRRAVVNASRSWLRRRALEQRHATEQRPLTTTTAPDELWDVLRHLTERQRAAIVLRYYEGLPDNDIAALLGCRVGTVRTTIHRALGVLRQEIER